MEEILALRHELAQLLGFENYAFKSLATKMAENPQQVLDFLTDLAKRARPQGEKELAQLRAFAKAEFGVDELQPWAGIATQGASSPTASSLPRR